MEQSILKALANRLNLTDLDEEPENYILTPEEEEKAIRNEINSLKSHLEWKMKDKGVKDGDIALKLSTVNWNEEIDREDTLKRANSNKIYGIWQKKQRAKENELQAEKIAQLKKRCTANYMFNLISWTSENVYGKELIVNADTTNLIKTICFFLSKDERFETEMGHSLKKGLLLRGISGLGKSYIIECVKDNELQPISILSMVEIAEEIKSYGEYNLQYLDKIIYLDDVGTEEHTINHYGTKINFFKNFIEVYYQKMRVFNKLIISTNNSFKEMEQKYGFRVRSRIKDMFNIIDVTGRDMRGELINNDDNE